MCGISGMITGSLGGDEVLGRLRSMGCLQRHRGPDDADEMVFESDGRFVGLGFVRLSILDLETGMQPILSVRDGCAIICNGQIYNYLELRDDLTSETFVTRGDIEVALHLYRKTGPDFLNHLNGMYAGAVFDPIRKRVVLFRDRFGIKPLYYTVNSRGFFFSSEIKPLLEGSGTSPELNRDSLPVYFSYRYVPGESTMFVGVRRLPPGSFLVYDLQSGEYSITRYWEYLPGSAGPCTGGEEAEERFMELLLDSVRIRMRSDVEVASLVSGGIDSSSVASIAASARPGLKLFTVSFDDPLYDELDDVRSLMKSEPGIFGGADLFSRTCGPGSLERLPGLLRSVEDCISLGTILPTDQVCELASEHVKVVLTGEGADEIFAGYRKFLLEMAADEIDSMSPGERDLLMGDFPELENYLSTRVPDPAARFIQSELLFSPAELSRLLGIEEKGVPFPADAMPAVTGGMHPLDQLLAMECRSRLPDYVVLRLDKLSMRHSLETRTPYLDYRLAEFAAGLPVRLKVNLAGRMGKYICRRSLLKHGTVDRATAFREKKPFTIPMAAWLLRRDVLPEFVGDVLEGGRGPLNGFLNMNMVRALWNSVTAEGVGPDTLVSEADRVFAILTFGLWTGEFLV
ncbi:MAG: asparagine synthase (glutamine-hydrolyzing) [Candidatus Fermentibacteraceae bacterium]|nr:asparagine synthase (glutamine-hydrolyzing) [Candidatus Fermentibacteraceae bacterium]